MCQQQNIKIINHTDTIDPSKHLNESLFHLNRYGAIEFANNFKKILCNLDWRDVGNSEGLDHYEANISDSVKDTFHYDHNEVLSENGDEVSILCSEYNYNYNNIKDDLVDIDPVKVLNNIRQKQSNRLVIAQLNINSLRNKFASLSTMIKDYVDLLLISETKIDSSFPTAQFHIDGYTIHRRDRDENGGGLLLYVREDVPSALLKTEIEAFYVELTIRKKKWLLCCSYNPNKTFIAKHLAEIIRNRDLLSSKYDNFILLGHFNSEPCEQPKRDFCHVYNCQDIIKDKTYFKNLHNPSCVDLFVTTRSKSFQNSSVIETGCLISTKCH